MFRSTCGRGSSTAVGFEMDPSVRINGLILLVFISLAYLSHPVGAWDQTELEIFDLVEEINRIKQLLK